MVCLNQDIQDSQDGQDFLLATRLDVIPAKAGIQPVCLSLGVRCLDARQRRFASTRA
jgi:hypothetical protein